MFDCLFIGGFRMFSVEYTDDNTVRMERSLGLLATKFVSLLQNSKDGILDLNMVIIQQDDCSSPTFFTGDTRVSLNTAPAASRLLRPREQCCRGSKTAPSTAPADEAKH